MGLITEKDFFFCYLQKHMHIRESEGTANSKSQKNPNFGFLFRAIRSLANQSKNCVSILST